MGPPALKGTGKEATLASLGTPASAPSTQSKVTPRRMFSHLCLETMSRKTLLSLSLSCPMRKELKWRCKWRQEDLEFKASLVT